MHHVLGIDGIGGTLAERKIIDSIQQIGLPHPILSDETIHLVRKVKFHLFQILIVQYGNMLQYHGPIIFSGHKNNHKKENI